MRARFLMLTVLFLGYFLNAKSQEFIVKGAIFERGTNLRVALAAVVNTRTQLAVGSNDLGLFQIKVKVGDTLLVSKSELNDERIVVKDQNDIIVYLPRGTINLQQVNVYGNTKKQDLEEIKREFKNKGVYNGGKSSVLSAIFSPLNGIYNLFGKDPKNARRFARYADNEIKQSQIDQYFNPSIIKNNTPLRGDTLEKYMVNCRPEFEKAKNWNSYDYIKYIKESAKKFTDTLGKGK